MGKPYPGRRASCSIPMAIGSTTIRNGEIQKTSLVEWDGVPTDIDGNPIPEGGVHIHDRGVANKKATNAHEELFNTIVSVIDDGHDLVQLYVDGAREASEGPVPGDYHDLTDDHMRTLADLRDPDVLAQRNR